MSLLIALYVLALILPRCDSADSPDPGDSADSTHTQPQADFHSLADHDDHGDPFEEGGAPGPRARGDDVLLGDESSDESIKFTQVPSDTEPGDSGGSSDEEDEEGEGADASPEADAQPRSAEEQLPEFHRRDNWKIYSKQIIIERPPSDPQYACKPLLALCGKTDCSKFIDKVKSLPLESVYTTSKTDLKKENLRMEFEGWQHSEKTPDKTSKPEYLLCVDNNWFQVAVEMSAVVSRAGTYFLAKLEPPNPEKSDSTWTVHVLKKFSENHNLHPCTDLGKVRIESRQFIDFYNAETNYLTNLPFHAVQYKSASKAEGTGKSETHPYEHLAECDDKGYWFDEDEPESNRVVKCTKVVCRAEENEDPQWAMVECGEHKVLKQIYKQQVDKLGDIWCLSRFSKSKKKSEVVDCGHDCDTFEETLMQTKDNQEEEATPGKHKDRHTGHHHKVKNRHGKDKDEKEQAREAVEATAAHALSTAKQIEARYSPLVRQYVFWGDAALKIMTVPQEEDMQLEGVYSFRKPILEVFGELKEVFSHMRGCSIKRGDCVGKEVSPWDVLQVLVDRGKFRALSKSPQKSAEESASSEEQEEEEEEEVPEAVSAGIGFLNISFMLPMKIISFVVTVVAIVSSFFVLYAF